MHANTTKLVARLSGKLACAKSELRLDITLACGQSFRWKENKPGVWTSVLAGKVWHLSQDDKTIIYEVQDPDMPCEKADQHIYEDILRDYFQLQINLGELYEKWGAVDPKFAAVAGDFNGVRILRQDPVENLFSFICSSNNHISRISGMVEKLCTHYGQLILREGDSDYYAFPTVKALTREGVETKLRQLGFGYRAKYISDTAKYMHENCSADWLSSLRSLTYEDAKAELVKLKGVGAKVADCVCLMSLDKTGAIPVDTHVWQIAARDYMPKLRTAKSLTDSLYKQIGDVFRELWGPYAGWAHSVMFSADLKKFQEKKSMENRKKKKADEREKEHDLKEDSPVPKTRKQTVAESNIKQNKISKRPKSDELRRSQRR